MPECGPESYQPDYVLTSDLLAESVIEADTGPDTIRATVPDFPAVYIRKAPDGELFSKQYTDLATVRDEYRCYLDLERTGLKVIPIRIVIDTDDRLAIMTHRIEGVPLDEKLTGDPEVAKQYDEIAARHIEYLAEANIGKHQHPIDTFGSQQCMWGKLYGSSDEPRILFADVSPSIWFEQEGKDQIESGDFVMTIMRAARLVMLEEEDLGIMLPRSHAELELQCDTLLTMQRAAEYWDTLEALQEVLKANDVEQLEELINEFDC